MSLKLACADFTFPLLPHDKSLDLIAMLGFEGVDIGLFEGRSHLWPSRVFADLKGVSQGPETTSCTHAGSSWPTCSCRQLPISYRSLPIIRISSSGARRGIGLSERSSSRSRAAAGTSRHCRA